MLGGFGSHDLRDLVTALLRRFPALRGLLGGAPVLHLATSTGLGSPFDSTTYCFVFGGGRRCGCYGQKRPSKGLTRREWGLSMPSGPYYLYRPKGNLTAFLPMRSGAGHRNGDVSPATTYSTCSFPYRRLTRATGRHHISLGRLFTRFYASTVLYFLSCWGFTRFVFLFRCAVRRA